MCETGSPQNEETQEAESLKYQTKVTLCLVEGSLNICQYSEWDAYSSFTATLKYHAAYCWGSSRRRAGRSNINISALGTVLRSWELRGGDGSGGVTFICSWVDELGVGSLSCSAATCPFHRGEPYYCNYWWSSGTLRGTHREGQMDDICSVCP